MSDNIITVNRTQQDNLQALIESRSIDDIKGMILDCHDFLNFHWSTKNKFTNPDWYKGAVWSVKSVSDHKRQDNNTVKEA